MKELLRIWREREVRIALPALGISVLGDAMVFVALTLRVHASGAGPYAVAALLLCFALPVVLTMGVAGELADRVDPRKLIPAACAVQVTAAIGLACFRSLPATYALVIVLQLGFAITNPTWTTVLSRSVGDDRVGQLVSMQQALTASAAPAGAALGGIIVEHRGDGLVFVLDAVSYVVLAVAALGIRLPRLAPARRSGRTPFLPREGWSVLRAHPLAWALLWALVPFIVALESMNAVEVFLVRDVLGGSDADFGFWQAMIGAGALLGALGSGLISGDRRRAWAILIALTTISLTLIGVGFAPSLGWLFVLGAIMGLANAVSNASIFAIFVRGAGAESRGRTLALLNGVARSTSLVALGLGGVAGAVLGPRVSFVTAGVLGLGVAAWACWAVRGALGPDQQPAAAAAAAPTAGSAALPG